MKILLADDNINAQRMGSKILTDAGHEVIAVSNGAAALKKMAAAKPNLLILDVYMPGYTGLEVCEKIKNAPDTARVPVILTVTNMEPFNPEDGKRVKADGVMVKPFEASDLVAMVQKIESKLLTAVEQVDTVKIEAPPEFKDASYEEWKAEAPATPEMPVEPEPPAPLPVSVPQEMAVAPALGMEEIFAQPAPAAAPAPVFDLESTTSAPPAIAPPAELEFTSAPQVGAIEVAPAAELEASTQVSEVPVSLGQDPALVTDAADMAQFVTKFGAAQAEEEAPAAVAAEAPIEESPLGDVLASPPPVAAPAPAMQTDASSLEEEMRRAFESATAAAVPAPVTPAEPVAPTTPVIESIPEFSPAAIAPVPPLPEPAPEPAPVIETATQKLVAQFAAELDQVAGKTAASAPATAAPAAAAAAAPAMATDDQRIAEAVDRVLARYKRELVDAVKLELEK